MKWNFVNKEQIRWKGLRDKIKQKYKCLSLYKHIKRITSCLKINIKTRISLCGYPFHKGIQQKKQDYNKININVVIDTILNII